MARSAVVLGGALIVGGLAYLLWPKKGSGEELEGELEAERPLDLDWLPILQTIGREESGREWGRVGIEPGGGIAYGYWQLNQAAGVLGMWLRRWAADDPASFTAWAGADAPRLEALSAGTRAARLALDLSGAAWKGKLEAAGQIEAAKRAQLELILETYRDPLVPALVRAGLTDLVGAGLGLDRAINQGVGAATAALGRVGGGGTRDEKLEQFFTAVMAGLSEQARATVTARTNRVWDELEGAAGVA